MLGNLPLRRVRLQVKIHLAHADVELDLDALAIDWPVDDSCFTLRTAAACTSSFTRMRL